MALGFRIFDADNHYYEPTDAFTRHIDPRLAKRAMQWVEMNGKPRLLVGGRLNRFIPNPTFDPIARPGSLDDYFRGRKGRSDDGLAAAFGDLEPIRPEYRDRDARLALMDEQDLEAVLMFPTLAVGMEEALVHDPDALHGAFEAFNRWLEDDWGYAYRDRIYSAPYVPLVDLGRAVAEVDRVLAAGARVLCMRSGPVVTPEGGRSPGDPRYDPFWARVAEAGVVVAFHSGDAGYGRFAELWGEPAEMEGFRLNPFKAVITADRPIADTVTALVCQGVFTRHPGVRVATIESGGEWVGPLMRKLAKIGRQMPGMFAEPPVEQLRRHVWVAPYYEDDIEQLVGFLGVDRVIMGSDFPHAEGIADPQAFAEELTAFSAADAKRIMHDNARELVEPAGVSAN